MSSNNALSKTMSCGIVAFLMVAPDAYAQTGTPPFPQRPASAHHGTPCPRDPMKRYDMADPGESHLFKPTGDPDRDFANMMSAHHQEGVDMAKRELTNGKSTKLKAVARRIIKDQERLTGTPTQLWATRTVEF